MSFNQCCHTMHGINYMTDLALVRHQSGGGDSGVVQEDASLLEWTRPTRNIGATRQLSGKEQRRKDMMIEIS